jgi:hypothetical protein
MTKCTGNGSCLDANTCERIVKCKFNCKGKKCPNYILCGIVAPQWLFDCCGDLCTNCDILFGKWAGGKGILETQEVECPICLEEKLGISQPKCNHFLCIECFKRCHYGDDDLENEPKFPYNSDIEEEYYDDPDNPEWANNEKIVKYNNDYNKWDDQRELKKYNESYLRQCPLCRK